MTDSLKVISSVRGGGDEWRAAAVAETKNCTIRNWL